MTRPAEPYHSSVPVDRTSLTDDERIDNVVPLPPPEHLIRFFPIRGTAMENLIGQTRQRIRRIMSGEDDRLLVVIGPCSIHDPEAAIEYAKKLQPLADKYKDDLLVVRTVECMRAPLHTSLIVRFESVRPA